MKRYSIFAFVVLIIYCCNNNNKKTEQTVSTQKTIDSFFPVTSFIKGQLLLLDSLPVTALHITVTKDITDSVWLTKDKLKPLLQPFITPVISETNLTGYFKETKFIDQTINAITFTYDPLQPLPDSIILQHWTIYINPESGKIIKIYIVKETKENNQDITQQLTWQTDKWAKITTFLNTQDGKMKLLKEDKIVWGFSE